MQELHRVAFFKDVSDVALAGFDHRCHWKRVEAGGTVVDFDDSSDDVYFILTGQVRVLIRTPSGKEIILGDLAAGQFFGEMSAIDGVKRSANVSVLTNAELCIMPAAVFREIVHKSAQACDKVMHLLAGRIRELNARLTEQSIFDLKHRLYSELLRLSLPRTGHAGERILSPPPFHHVLAARIGCRREQISRELTHMEREGLAQKTRGGLVIVKPNVLKSRIDEAMAEG